MEVIIVKDSQETGIKAADAIEELLNKKPEAVLGIATGSSPLPIYDELAKRVKAGKVSFKDAKAFSLDEYVGLPKGHPEGYNEVIRKEFTERLDIDPKNVHGPDGEAKDIPAACEEYEDAIKAAGGIDLQILGIGSDGHIGFNEPGSSLASRTRLKSLTEQTREDNARFFNSIDEVPYHVITQGLGTIMEAKHIVMVVSGENKAEAIHRFVEGPVSANCPASILQMHPHVTVLVDEDAASKLELGDYYRHTYSHKPQWQGF
ncbi:MAG: glucosamine-6-phosphate deaminase [Micrococcaceae bacterium]